MKYYLNVFKEYYRNSLGHVNLIWNIAEKMLDSTRHQYGVVKSSGRG